VPDNFSCTKIISLRPVLSCFIFFVCILLGSCYSLQNKDGPPNFYVDDSKVPNAVPKVEALSKYGNMAHYTVFGKQYYVMNSSRNYEEQGIASWYGAKFHSHTTSNGERYNMLAMTAAHKTLPLPTYVQVTNLSNGRQVIVKVNDRGPFEANRLIDLSYVAAKKLGMLGHGTTRVDVKAIDPRDALMHPELMAMKKPTPVIAPIPVATAKFSTYTMTQVAAQKPVKQVGRSSTNLLPAPLYIQVGAFRNRAYAEKLKSRLLGLVSSPIEINPSNSLYRVQIGPFKDVATANLVTQKLKSAGVHSERVSDDFDITSL
jgi:rare lipoprotein A